MMSDFFELLRSGLWGSECRMGREVDWPRIISMARKQTVLGIIKLPVEAMDKATADKVRVLLMRNIMAHSLLDRTIAELASFYREHGIDGVLLKGQGVARYYDEPTSRQCGDIDFYIRDGKMDDAIALAKAKWSAGMVEPDQETYKQFKFNIGDVKVELHRTPAVASRPWMRKRFNRWIADNVERPERLRHTMIGGVDVALPPVEFDALYIFFHAFAHLIETEGVGLRQLCDWAMVLHRFSQSGGDRQGLVARIREFGLERPWQIMGYIVVRHLGLPEAEMPLYTDKYAKESARLLEHILAGGNFGSHFSATRKRHGGYWGHKLNIYLCFHRNLKRMWYLSPPDVLGSYLWFTTNGVRRALARKLF